jgi:polar amino acid transport system substrate-binding protein
MRLIRLLTAVAAAAGLALAVASPASADLQDLLNAGKVRIGVPVDVAPFGYVDENNQPAGLDIDVARMVAEALGVELELTQITGANRVPFLATDKLDLVISAMGATPERALQVAFSSPYSALSIGVFGPEGIAITGPDEIGSHTIGVARGTTQDIELTALAPNATIQRFEDDATAAAAYLSGQVDLFATANIVAQDLSKKHPDKGFEAKFIIRFSPTHIAFQQGNPELGRWLDTFVFYNKLNGKLDELSRKWLGTALPEDLPSL